MNIGLRMIQSNLSFIIDKICVLFFPEIHSMAKLNSKFHSLLIKSMVKSSKKQIVHSKSILSAPQNKNLK